jgi:VIT1/CCC1 family predicted Fe2+/Mn2+ transporter
VGALPPVLLAWLWRGPGLAIAIVASTTLLLAVLGYVAERVAGGGGLKGAWRVLLWGSLAQAATALIGHAFGVSAG